MAVKQFTNQQLISGLANHDRSIIRYILQTMQPVIINVLMNRNATREQAADIFMDTLEALYREIKKRGINKTISKLDDPPKTKLQTYLTRVSMNIFFNQIRRKKVITGVTESQEKLYSEKETITTEIHEVMQRKLFLEKLHALGEDCRKILRLFFDKKSMKEIGAEMNISVQYAKKKKFTCKKKLIESIQLDHRYSELSN